MATFDDMEVERKLTVYDKGFDEDFTSYGEYIARSGDVWSPRVPNDEPLRIECEHFVDRVRDGPGAALRRRERAARGARAGGAAALARREPACSGRLTARPGLLLGEGVELPPTVEIGGNVVIHAGTRVGGEVRIQDGAVIGKPLALGAASTAAPTEPAPAAVGAGATVVRRRRGGGRGADRRGRRGGRPGARARARAWSATAR